MAAARDVLLLAGGGFKTVSYLGLLEARWAELTPSLRGICGVSAGAMLGLLLAVGYTPRELRECMLATAWPAVLREVLRDLPIARLLAGKTRSFGAPCDARPMRRVLQAWLAAKGVPSNATFAWLAAQGRPAFACVVASLATGRLLQLDASTAPSCSLLRAVLASAAVPFVFAPVRVGGEWCVDAGVVNNVPISVVRRAWPHWRRTLVLMPHAVSGRPESAWTLLLWHRANFMVLAELRQARTYDVEVVQLPLVPDDVSTFSPGASLALLVWQGRLMHLCRRHRAALAGAFLLCVARLLRPRYGGRRLPKA